MLVRWYFKGNDTKIEFFNKPIKPKNWFFFLKKQCLGKRELPVILPKARERKINQLGNYFNPIPSISTIFSDTKLILHSNSSRYTKIEAALCTSWVSRPNIHVSIFSSTCSKTPKLGQPFLELLCFSPWHSQITSPLRGVGGTTYPYGYLSLLQTFSKNFWPFTHLWI